MVTMNEFNEIVQNIRLDEFGSKVSVTATTPEKPEPYKHLPHDKAFFSRENVPAYGSGWVDICETTALNLATNSYHKIAAEVFCDKPLRTGRDTRLNLIFLYCPRCMVVLEYL